MTNEEIKWKVELLDDYLSHTCQDYGEDDHDAMMMAIKAVDENERLRNIVKLGIAKDCESCKAHKIDILDEIRGELIQSIQNGIIKIESGNEELFRILDKYNGESEEPVEIYLSTYYGPRPVGDEFIRTIHKAIKPFDREFSDDCVSRKFMYDLGATCIATRDKNGKLIALGAIEELPPVTPIHKDRTVQDFVDKCRECGKQKKGKWIFTKTIFDKHGCTVECSSCHKKWKTYEEIRWEKENKFCPNCGTKMEKEVEE